MDPILYHAHHTLRSEDIAFWRDLGHKTRGPVLELGCGTGRVLMRLVRDNIPSVGLDNDREMLDFLHHSIPPTLAYLVEVIEADMCSFNLERTFPLIILPCNTLSTFSGFDRGRIFQSVLHHLTPEGLFVFSIPNTMVLVELPEVGEVELEDEFAHPATRNPVQVYSSWEKQGRRMSFYWRYDHVYPNGDVVQAEHSTTHFLDLPQAYLAELKAAGLKPLAAYGDFYRANFEPQSAYFIVIAKSAASGA